MFSFLPLERSPHEATSAVDLSKTCISKSFLLPVAFYSSGTCRLHRAGEAAAAPPPVTSIVKIRQKERKEGGLSLSLSLFASQPHLAQKNGVYLVCYIKRFCPRCIIQSRVIVSGVVTLLLQSRNVQKFFPGDTAIPETMCGEVAVCLPFRV